MKKIIFLLLLMAKLSVVEAQYTVPQPVLGSNGYICKVLTDAGTSWTQSDLITWIFPDGQYMKRSIDLNDLAGTDNVAWQPNLKTPGSSDDIIVYVAKKGGPGTPVKRSVRFSGTYNGSTPTAFYFPPKKNWQLNRSWEFSPNNEDFLIFSYKPCQVNAGNVRGAGGNIRLMFNQQKIQLTPMSEYYSFNNETITPSANQFVIDINKGSTSASHVFFKVKSTTTVGELVSISIIGNCCGMNIDTTFVYETKGGPHDPNQKRVNVPTISNQGISKLLYTIQFHNDGKMPVTNVTVKDVLPPELNPSTFRHLRSKGSVTPFDPPSSGTTRNLSYTGLNLPGLNQTNPSYGYDETTYWSTFEVFTKPNVKTIIDNQAEVTFAGTSETISTNIARVTPIPPCPNFDNLVTNGHFRLGNNGSFQSGWPTPKCNSCTAASYCVGNQFKSKCSSWPANAFDHTMGTANGSFLIFDGDPSNPAMVWTSKACVTQGQIYSFSFWAKSLYSEPFPLGILIDGVLVSTVKVAQSTPVWTEYRVSWQAPVTKCLPISIKQMTKGHKRDFGLDDIVFGYCK